jgi:hypothetical protein
MSVIALGHSAGAHAGKKIHCSKFDLRIDGITEAFPLERLNETPRRSRILSNDRAGWNSCIGSADLGAGSGVPKQGLHIAT